MSILEKKNVLRAVSAAVLYMAVLWKLVPFVYGIIDDRTMMEIVSGQYLGHPDAHTIFLGYWYSLFLTGLYGALPSVDWYALCYLVFQGACISLVLYRLFSRQRNGRKKLLCAAAVLLFFTVFGLQATAQLTFTTTAAVLGVTVIFWYITSEQIRFADWLLLFILCFLTEEVRPSIFFMILPVCGMLWLFRVMGTEGRSRWNLLIPAAVCGVLILSAVGNQIGYGSAEWKAYQQYNQNRSAVYDYADYTFPIYEGAEAFYESVGIEKKSRARTLMNYNYTADEQITPEFFGEYIEAYEKAFPAEEGRAGRVRESVKDYLKGVVSGRFHMVHLLSLLLYGLLAARHMKKKEWLCCWQTIGVAGIQILLWLYLLYVGRIPERVIYSMNLMFVGAALFLWLEILRNVRIPEKIYRAGAGAVLLILAILACLQLREIRQENLEMSRRNEDIESLKEYCAEHPENFYFNDVTSLAFTTWNVRLWKKEPCRMNYMSLGDWMSYSPIWREKLNQKGITGVKDALYGKNQVYLICSFDKGLEYLISLYDDVECTEIDKIPGFKIYRLQFL